MHVYLLHKLSGFKSFDKSHLCGNTFYQYLHVHVQYIMECRHNPLQIFMVLNSNQDMILIFYTGINASYWTCLLFKELIYL